MASTGSNAGNQTAFDLFEKEALKQGLKPEEVISETARLHKVIGVVEDDSGLVLRRRTGVFSVIVTRADGCAEAFQ